MHFIKELLIAGKLNRLMSYAVELINAHDGTNIAFELIRAKEAKLLEDKEIVNESFMLEQLENARECRNEAIVGYYIPIVGLPYCVDASYCTIRNMSDVVKHFGNEVVLIVTCINSVTEFYAHINDVPGRKQFIRNTNVKAVVDRYEKILPDEVLRTGDAVMAFIENENIWYRAVILSIDSCQKEYKVFLIDFGDVFVCKKKNLRYVPDIFVKVPPQAVRCHLMNIKAKSDVDQSQAIKFFENIAVEKTFHANVFYKEYFLAVKLTNKNGEDIGQKLVEAGYADVENEIIIG